jgi:5-methylcytosine-specific restriction endonuclease McrA
MDIFKKPILVLNKIWIPIRVITSMRAFKLLFAGKAFVVNPVDYSIYSWEEWVKVPAKEGDVTISTTRADIILPEVIALSHYDKLPKKGMKLTKKNLFIRDSYTCQYTGDTVSTKNADIDHVIPKSRGGKTSWENLVVCSKNINRRKANKTPQEAGLRLLKKPTKPSPQVIFIDPRMDMPKSWKNFIAKQKS